MNKINLIGKKFGRLMVIEEDIDDQRSYDVFWKCQCDCGKIVSIGGNALRRGVTNSCGCLAKEQKHIKKLNKYVIENDVIKIILNNNLECVIDKDDFNKVKKFTWHTHNGYSYTYDEINKKYVPIHQKIVGYSNVDHIDGNKLNNRKNNLRPATPQQNSWNKDKRRDNKSGFKGVYKGTSAWIATIQKQYLGSFKTKEEAASAYDRKATELYGEYAKTNFKYTEGDRRYTT